MTSRSSVRDLVRDVQIKLRDEADLTPQMAAMLLAKLAALLGNINDEIREADSRYADHLLACFKLEPKANRARILAETSPAYERKQEARHTRELAIEMIRSLKYILRSQEEEMRLSR